LRMLRDAVVRHSVRDGHDVSTDDHAVVRRLTGDRPSALVIGITGSRCTEQRDSGRTGRRQSQATPHHSKFTPLTTKRPPLNLIEMTNSASTPSTGSAVPSPR